MKLQYVRAFIVLLAGLITLIMNIKTGKDVNTSLLTVLIVILIFYVIATLIVEILQKSLMKTEDADEEDAEQTEETEGTGEELYDDEEESVLFEEEE